MPALTQKPTPVAHIAPVAHIMIVDDNPVNLRLLEEMLQESCEVHSFPLGRLALAAAARNPPDLILLDVNMPEMNGYEVCEHLKAIESLANIPVIFLSALDGTEDKVRAFISGAADYISKPFQLAEVRARVRTHLDLHSLQRALEMHNHQLESAVGERTRELAEANARLTILDRSKNDFLTLISHEFRTPLNGILGISELLLEEFSTQQQARDLRVVFENSRRRILSILDDALLLTQIDISTEKFHFGPVNLRIALSRAVEDATEFAKSRNLKFVQPWIGDSFVVANEHLLAKALCSLLETAVKFSREGGRIFILCESGPESRTLIIETSGDVIPVSALPKFFDMFAIAEAITPGGDFGLGPCVAYRILSLCGASVRVENIDPAGIRFTIPLKNANPQPV